MEVLSDGPWDRGVDSSTHSLLLQKGTYPWCQNCVNTGALITTRQGFAEVQRSEIGPPRGIEVFTPVGGVPHIVVALSDGIYHTPFPFTAPLTRVVGLTFSASTRRVYFKKAVQAQTTDDQGNIHILPTPKPILMIQDGVSRAGYWDGTVARHMSWADKECPIGSWMEWIGSRLWVAQGMKLYASDIYNPIQFIEAQPENLATGGFLVLPEPITGLGVTFDFKSLLVGTDITTTAVQAGITDRTLWSRTQDFQRVMFPNIGMVSGRMFVNQYGISWWMSHDGVIGLDNALQTYQTSAIHVKDQNMSKSKAGITSWQDGGCAGTFGNFLWFSVPSGSYFNRHTWVMDQSVINTLQRDAPSAWSANWTGVRPEQWVTAVIRGQKRCFCVSNDPVPEGFRSIVWEAFIGQRQDAPYSPAENKRVAHDIACAWEGKFLALSPNQYMRFRYAEIDITEIQGRVNLEVYYCGRLTSYKSILKKKIYARPAGQTDLGDFSPDSVVGVSMPQSRTINTQTDMSEESDNDPLVQTEAIRSIDRAFSVLVTWTGRMSVEAVRVFADPIGKDTEGLVELDETTDRWIDAEGHGAILDTPTQPNQLTSQIQSQNLEIFTPRWVEFPDYNAGGTNGVFFCVMPMFTPPAGAYPGSWPKDVNIESETSNSQIIYTTDGTRPTYNDPTHFHGTLIPNNGIAHVPMHHTLKAIAIREGMTNSAVQSGLYDKPTVVAPTFTPIAGGRPVGDYPLSVTVATATPGCRMRWTLNGVNPTRSQGNLISASSGVVSVSGPPKTLKVIAYKEDLSQYDSTVTTGIYSVQPKVATPTITPDGGEFPNYPLSFVLGSTPGTHIRYTTDGSAPTEEHGTLVAPGGNGSIPSPTTVKAIAFKDNWINSDVKSSVFTQPEGGIVEPTFNPEGGHFGLSLTVHIHTDTVGCTLYYTKDGSTPGPDNPNSHRVNASDAYAGFNFSEPATRTLQAVAVKDGLPDSEIHSAIYYFGH